MFSDLEQSILTTISFFDAMSLPATPLEIYFNLINCGEETRQCPVSASLDYFDFLKILETSKEIKSKTDKFNGMYSIKGDRDEALPRLYNHRQINYRMAIKKWIILRRLAKFFDLIPFIQAIFAGGSITRNNTSENSDIDIFIVAKHGRIWTARALLAIFYLMRKYRHKDKTKDKLCFNHFISDKNLEIKHKSIYTAELYSKFVPIFDRRDVAMQRLYTNDFRQKNSWIKKYLFLWPDVAPRTLRKFKGNILFRAACSVLEFALSGFIGNLFENFARKIQQPKIAKGAGKSGGRVVFTDEEIELHPDSPERKLIGGLNEKLRKIGIEEEWKDSGLASGDDRI